MLNRLHRCLAVAAVLAVATGPSCATQASEPQALDVKLSDAKPRPDLDALFQQTDGWIGADGDYSLPLGKDRALWLFSDTWIGKIRAGKRVDATLVNNTVGVMEGHGRDAKMRFFIAEGADKKPTAIYKPNDGRGWFWPLGCVTVNDRLYVALAHMDKAGQGAFGFRPLGRVLAIVDHRERSPLDWKPEYKAIPHSIVEAGREVAFGAAMLHDGDWIYLFGTDESREKGHGPNRRLIVAKAPADKLDDFTAWRFYQNGQWQVDFRASSPLADNLATECSVSYLTAARQYVLVYTDGGLSPKIVARVAEHPWGPWSAASVVYECPEMKADKGVFCYAAKAHPELSTDDELVISYAVNAFELSHVINDATLYWPRFVSVQVKTAR